MHQIPKDMKRWPLIVVLNGQYEVVKKLYLARSTIDKSP